MDQHYLPSVPITFAFRMAGFKGRQSFHLKRNEKVPPIELQRLIFHSLRRHPGTETNKSWRQECLDDMNEKDGDHPEQSDDISLLDPPASGANVLLEHLATRKRFYKLLVRLRRVILQGAVVYLHLHKSVKSPLLEHSVFNSELFLQFYDQLAPILDQDDVPLPLELLPTFSTAPATQTEQHQGQVQLTDQSQRFDFQVKQRQADPQERNQQPVVHQDRQQQEESLQLYLVNQMNELKRLTESLQQAMLLWEKGHVSKLDASSSSAARTSFTVHCPSLSHYEQIQHVVTSSAEQPRPVQEPDQPSVFPLAQTVDK